jgi:hypothetical protein
VTGDDHLVAPKLRHWSLYGLRLASEHVFENRVPEAAPGREPDVTFRIVEAPPTDQDWQLGAPAYASPAMIDDERHFLTVHLAPSFTVMRFTEVADFYLSDDRIDCVVLDPAYAYMVELHLLGYVLGYWLERHGLVAIHASSVVVDGRAVGFLATNKGGKSSLAAGLMAAGHALLSDDVLVLAEEGSRFLGRPGYPQMRMWPEQAREFVATVDSLERVHPLLSKRRVPVGPGGFGRFCTGNRPVTALYLPDRREGPDTEVSITPVPLAEAVFELVKNSFLIGIVESTGMQEQRFERLARVAGDVRVRRITYPSGYDRLPEVCRAIVDDVRGAQPAP